jgi:hypothetical protein
MTAPEPPPAYSNVHGGLVPGRAVGEVSSEEDRNGTKKDEEGDKAGRTVGYK